MQIPAFPLALPPQLLQALGELDIPLDGVVDAAGDDFWLRLAEQLEQLEELAPVLPQEWEVDDLAEWLAAALDGAELPEGGKSLPLSAGTVMDGIQIGKAQEEHAVRTGPELLRERIPAAVVRLAAGVERTPAVMLPPAVAEMSTRGESEPAAFLARPGEIHQAGQGSPTISGAAESVAGPQLSPANPGPPRTFLSLDIPLQQPGWDRALGSRVQWMVNQDVQVAELKLNPPNLGPLEVRVQVEGDRTHVHFLAPQASVREAVEAALPRLRELFAEDGLSLGDVTVFHQGTDRNGAGGRGDAQRHGAGTIAGDTDPGDIASNEQVAWSARGLVDYYA